MYTSTKLILHAIGAMYYCTLGINVYTVHVQQIDLHVFYSIHALTASELPSYDIKSSSWINVSTAMKEAIKD